MNDREGRIVMFGMLLGAAIGGAVVLAARMKTVRAQPPTLVQPKPSVDWVDLLNIGAAAFGIARRISALVENPELTPKK